MSYLNSVTIIGFVGADPEQRQARNNNGSKFTVLSVATQRSWKNAQDEWSVRDWRNSSRRRSRKARTCSLRAALSARRTNAKLAKARKPRPPSRPFGAFAPMSCASSIAASLSRKQSFPVLMLRSKSSKHPMAIPSRRGLHWPSGKSRRAFFHAATWQRKMLSSVSPHNYS